MKLKIWTKIKFSFAYKKAFDYDQEKEYQKIIDTLENYRTLIDEKPDAFPDYYILLGEAYFRLTNYHLAEGLFLKALEVLETTKKLNENETAYLKLYTYRWLQITYQSLEKYSFKTRYKILSEKVSYDTNKIRRTIKEYFLN